MISIIPIEDSLKWDETVRSFHFCDVYYLSGYVKAFQVNGDGIPILLHYSHGSVSAICVFFKRDIASDPFFATKGLESGRHFDLITPYGYGGFVFNNIHITEQEKKDFSNEIITFLKKQGYVSAFFRFHPVLRNDIMHPYPIERIVLGHTIALDLSSPETIWQNITSKNRNMIRKAEKSGVTILHGKGCGLLKDFKEIYDETMRHDKAENYYFFPDSFYNSIDHDLPDNYEIFYASLNDEIIAMSIILYDNKQMHYHLSGSKFEFRNFAPSNLLLYKAALWGNSHGIKTFHLGGGIGAGEDNLYKFKAAFNRNSDYSFSIGKLIINLDDYNELVRIRDIHPESQQHTRFFPAYRAPSI